jgi:hypothetical protein
LSLGWAFGKRGGLTLAGAALFFKETREAFDLGAQLGRFAFEADTVKAWCFGHTFTVAGGVFFSCASLSRKWGNFDERAARR